MRVLKLVLAGIVVAVTLVVGLATAFFAAVLALVWQFFRSFVRKAPSPASSARSSQPARASRSDREDAIEVTATEVPPDGPHR